MAPILTSKTYELSAVQKGNTELVGGKNIGIAKKKIMKVEFNQVRKSQQ